MTKSKFIIYFKSREMKLIVLNFLKEKGYCVPSSFYDKKHNSMDVGNFYVYMMGVEDTLLSGYNGEKFYHEADIVIQAETEFGKLIELFNIPKPQRISCGPALIDEDVKIKAAALTFEDFENLAAEVAEHRKKIEEWKNNN